MKGKYSSAKKLDKKFDKGEDIVEHLDLPKAERPELKPYRVNIDFPQWMVKELDQEAERLGVPRQSVIKFWISEKLEK